MTGSVVLEWSFAPWRDARGVVLRSVVAAAACAAVVTVLADPPLVRAALALVAASSCAAPLLPVRCRLDADGVTRHTPLGSQRRRWEELRRAVVRAHGIRLSPFARAHWLDAFRALELPLPARDSALRAAIDTHLRAHGL